MSARPTSLVILGHRFEVKWTADSAERTTKDAEYWALGSVDLANQQIGVREAQAFTQLKDTLLHEILHVLVRMQAHQDRFRPFAADRAHPEEPVVYALATSLLSVLRGNPKLVAWLTEEETAA